MKIKQYAKSQNIEQLVQFSFENEYVTIKC